MRSSSETSTKQSNWSTNDKTAKKACTEVQKKFVYASMQAKEWMQSDDPHFQRKGSVDFLEAAYEYEKRLVPLFTKKGKLQKNKMLRYCREHA